MIIIEKSKYQDKRSNTDRLEQSANVLRAWISLPEALISLP